MKVITTNLLNRFWKNGVKPIKDAVELKFDTSKILKSANITEEGFVMDGKTVTEQFAELNGKLLNMTTIEEFSLSNGTSVAPIARQRCFKVGNRVRISFECNISGATTNATPFAVIPEKYRPKSDMSSIFGVLSVSQTNACRVGSIKIFSNSNYSHGLIGQSLTSSVSSGSISFMFEYYM